MFGKTANSQAVLNDDSFPSLSGHPEIHLAKHFLIYVIKKNVKGNILLNLRYELNVLHKTSICTRSVFFSWFGSKFQANRLLGKAGEVEGKEENLVTKLNFFLKPESEHMSSHGSM